MSETPQTSASCCGLFWLEETLGTTVWEQDRIEARRAAILYIERGGRNQLVWPSNAHKVCQNYG
jgi:hypothetical protein